MKVKVHTPWLILAGSMVMLVLLRNHKVWLTVWVAFFVVASLSYLFGMPWLARRKEQQFVQTARQLLVRQNLDELRALAAQQRILRHAGRQHIISDTLALGASMAGDHEAARALYLEALASAPPEDKLRIELNLASEETATGRYDAAEGRLRGILRRRQSHPIAVHHLAITLVKKGDLEQAIWPLKQALEMADSREGPKLKLMLAEALITTGQSDWAPLLEAARSGGVDAEELARVEALASSQSDTRG